MTCWDKEKESSKSRNGVTYGAEGSSMCRLKSPVIIRVIIRIIKILRLSGEEEIKFSGKEVNFEIKVGLEKNVDR
jgi:hypothetical protein